MSKSILKAVCAAAVSLILVAGANAFPIAFERSQSRLTPAQRAKMTEIEKKGRAELQAVQISLGTREEKAVRIKAIIKKYQDAEMAVLTPAQRKQAEAIRAARMKQLAQAMAVQKTITPQQRAKASSIRTDYSRRARAVAQNKKLTDLEKRAQLLALQKDMNRALFGILTPQQRAALPQQK